MSDLNEFSVNENTFKKMLNEKNNSKFKNLSWDEWFENMLSKKSVMIPNMLEKVVRKFYEKDFDEWVTNFAGNLNFIWKESSAGELPIKKNQQMKSAIVIGRGPSLKKFNHLEILAKSDYSGAVVCSDGILKDALESGVNPEKFSNFYVVTTDPYKEQKLLYDHKIIDEFGAKIKGIFSTLMNPDAAKRARESGINIFWLHPLFDYHEGKKSFNKIAALMVRAKNHVQGLPAIQTGGNVGTSAWFVSWQILKCNTVSLIGINHGWEQNDPLELIQSHGHNSNLQILDENDPKFKKLYPTIFNPDFKTFCILDPIFQYYSNALKEFISRSPSHITTINCTEGGSIFGNNITGMYFNQFLDKHPR
jgi:hypothetical protein